MEQWTAAWDALRAAASLEDDEFVLFLRDFAVWFSATTEARELRPDHHAADADLATLAATLQKLVADPARPVELSRDQLLDRLGWSDRVTYRHPHRFPVPAVYTANEAARAALEERLRTLTGGYVALVGPAGSGKSTLLASCGPSATIPPCRPCLPRSPGCVSPSTSTG